MGDMDGSGGVCTSCRDKFPIHELGHALIWWGLAAVSQDIANPLDVTDRKLYCPGCRRKLNKRAMLWS